MNALPHSETEIPPPWTPVAAAPRRRPWGWAVALGLLALAGGAGWAVSMRPPVMIWETVPAARRDLENSITASGRIEPFAYVDVGAQVSGRLDRLLVSIGDQVQAGQPLAVIDAEVQAARIEGLDAGLAELRADRAVLEAQLTFAERAVGRQASLAGHAAARVTLEEATRERDVLRARIEGLDAAIRRAGAELRAEQALLAQARISAPMAGTVVALDAREGQTLNANYDTPVLMRIADLGVMTVRSEVSEADVTHLSPGMPVWFSTLGAPDRRHHATLRQILPAPPEAAEGSASTAVSYIALFDIENPGGELRPGMTAQVFFVTESAPDVLAVPVSALDDEGRLRVLIAGQPESRTPVTGLRTRAHVEIREGLSAGEAVITAGREEAGTSLLRIAP